MALGLFGEIDGTRVAFTGDNLLQGSVSPLRRAVPVNSGLRGAEGPGIRV